MFQIESKFEVKCIDNFFLKKYEYNTNNYYLQRILTKETDDLIIRSTLALQ